MKVLVCGSRDWRDVLPIENRLRQLPQGSHVIHGAQRSHDETGYYGADYLADLIARALGLAVTEFPADWKRLGRRAGPQRNRVMLDEKPDLVIAFWKDGSPGTGDTVREARRRGIPVEIVGVSS